ncbi:hypothetical protein CEQ90_05260 [Lewinellaceae bacterium SD302]|nr:hypothetical protein CEQ90_05260 [Lewinellaceae bacterium SD302]
MQRKITSLIALVFFSVSLFSQSVVTVTPQPDVSTGLLAVLLGGPDNVNYPLKTYKLVYTTTNPFGTPTVASGLIAIPTGDNLPEEMPVVVYNHGTVPNRTQVPSNPTVFERALPYLFATNGYIAIAPDYLGLGDNPGLHPYVHAETEATAGYDMILALREWLDQEEINYNDQLFTTGYSQGGHASMALQQYLQEDPTDLLPDLTAAANLSGPYGISTVMADVLFDPTTVTLPGYLAYTYISYNYVYELYDDLNGVFRQPYADPIIDFSNEEIDLDDLNEALFTLLANEGDDLPDMFQDSILNILQNEPDHPINVALRDNDTYNFAPEAPTLLVYCTQDEQVPFQNALLADSITTALGSDQVELLNGGATDHGGCVNLAIEGALNFFNQFAVFSSVFEVAEARQLNISPNPVKAGAELRIQDAPATGLDFEIFSLTGQPVQSGHLAAGNNVISLENLQAGVYYLTTRSDEGRTANKIVVD